MQLTPILPPPLPTATPQDLATKAVPHIQAQASAPLTRAAVDPSPRGEGSHKSRSNAEKAKGGGRGGSSGGKGGSSVNIQV
ncbi:MAG: hypothetical protein ABTQ34_06225 [Bdellovibrionales bacterium]